MHILALSTACENSPAAVLERAVAPGRAPEAERSGAGGAGLLGVPRVVREHIFYTLPRAGRVARATSLVFFGFRCHLLPSSHG